MRILICAFAFLVLLFQSSATLAQTVIEELTAADSFSTWNSFDSGVDTSSGDIAIDVSSFGGLGLGVSQVDFSNGFSVIEVEAMLGPNNAASTFVVNLIDTDGTGGDGLPMNEVYQYEANTGTLSTTEFRTLTLSLNDPFYNLDWNGASSTPDDGTINYGLVELGMQSVWQSTERLDIVIRRISIVDSTPAQQTGTVVERNGRLQVEGNRVVNRIGAPACLAGNSIFWSNWTEGARFYVPQTVAKIASDWNSSIIRASMGVDVDGGYAHNNGQFADREFEKVTTVIDAAIANGVYVIVDFHSHYAEDYTAEAVTFFNDISAMYGGYDNVIYEVYNEPIDTSWSEIKSYAETVISAIRQNDPDNLIIVGTRFYSQEVDVASTNPINDPNVAYTLHFYAGTHGDNLRARAITAMNNGVAIFITEWGSVDASGNGAVDYGSTNTWMEFCRDYGICHANWSIADKDESSAVVAPNQGVAGLENDNLTESGFYVRGIISNWTNYVGKPLVAFGADSLIVNNGSLRSGDANSTNESDNLDLAVSRSNTSVSAVVEFELSGTSSVSNPEGMGFTIEGSVFARDNDIVRQVMLKNYNTGDFEMIDTRTASRFVDSSTFVVPPGDVSRFVDSANGGIEARIRYSSPVARTKFTVNLDYVLWEVQ